MPIRSIEDYQLALEAQQDPEVPPEAKEQLRTSMQAFQRAQSGQVDLSELSAERDSLEQPSLDAPTGTGKFEVPTPVKRGPRVGAPGMPSHLGGSVEQKVDPSFNEFVRQNAAALESMAPEVRESVMSNGTNAPEYQQWADQQWEQEAHGAEASGRRLERLPAETFKTYEPEAGIGSRLGKAAGNTLDAGLALAGGALDSGALVVPGAGTALAGLDGEDTANQWRQRQERHPVAATVGSALGAVSPQNLAGLAAKGLYSAGAKVAGYVAPKVEGLLALGGRTVGSGLVGGATAVGEGRVRDAVNEEVYGETPAAGNDWERAKEGALFGAGANLVGEAAGAVSDMTRNAHPEISGTATGEGVAQSAEAAGVRPGLTGLLATRDSPARRLEAQRVAQGDEALRQTATGNAAPKIADAAAADNSAMLAQSAGETAAIHQKLSTAGGPPQPRATAVGSVKARGAAELQGRAELNPDKLKATDAPFFGASPEEATAYATQNMPPVEVGVEPSGMAYVIDGAHRIASARKAGATGVRARVREYDAEGNTVAVHDDVLPMYGERANASRPTVPPGPGDAEADAFGRIAREQGEMQASHLGIKQAVTGGPRVTPDPVPGVPMTVSTGPIAEATIGIIERRADPRTGQTHAFFNDNDLRKELPKIFDVSVMPLEQAAQRAQAEGGWVQPLDRLVQIGILDQSILMSQGKVGYLKPKELDSRQFDELVQVLQHKAKLDGNLQPDPRYGELAAVATKTRGEFPGLNELNTQQSQRFDQYKKRAEHAGLPVGKNKQVPTYNELPANNEKALHNALAEYKAAGRSEGARLGDRHFEAIAKAGGPEVQSALRSIPMAGSVDELRRAILPTVQGSLGVGGMARVAGSALVRLNPTLRAMGSVPDIQALGEKLNPQLKDVLRKMRVRPTVSRVGVAALSGRIGLRGGVAGARGAQASDEHREDDQLTREDLENLLKLKRATQRAQQ